jgi:hypothetical protein
MAAGAGSAAGGRGAGRADEAAVRENTRVIVKANLERFLSTSFLLAEIFNRGRNGAGFDRRGAF